MIQKQPPQNVSEHYNAILIEDLKSEFRAVAEGLVGLQQKMETEHSAIRKDIKGLHGELTDHIGFTHNAFKSVREDIKELKTEINRVETTLTGEINRVEASLTTEIREVGEKVGQHDNDIDQLKRVLGRQLT
ncbi:MAG: hypothetical protein HY540_05845 [Deltaproteobacteria bacterium]|nr:hypothetical protein [Deltaproteobacteria bacterium]